MKQLAIKIVLALFILGLPLLVFANVWYSYRYYELERQISDLEDQQQQLIERNKRLITGISILRSPGRIITEARKLGMEMSSEDQILLVKKANSE